MPSREDFSRTRGRRELVVLPTALAWMYRRSPRVYRRLAAIIAGLEPVGAAH